MSKVFNIFVYPVESRIGSDEWSGPVRYTYDFKDVVRSNVDRCWMSEASWSGIERTIWLNGPDEDTLDENDFGILRFTGEVTPQGLPILEEWRDWSWESFTYHFIPTSELCDWELE